MAILDSGHLTSTTCVFGYSCGCVFSLSNILIELGWLDAAISVKKIAPLVFRSRVADIGCQAYQLQCLDETICGIALPLFQTNSSRLGKRVVVVMPALTVGK